MSKLLQWTGGFALLLFTGTGVVAWALVTDRIDVTVQPSGDARSDVDPLANVSDQLSAMRDDVRALAHALGENFQRFADGLEQRASAEREAQAGVLASLAARLDALEQATAARDAALLEMLAGAASTPAAAPPPAAPAGALVAAADPAASAAVTPLDAPAAEVAAPAEPPTRKRSFLAFELPSDRFSFAGRQRFAILGSLSRVGFDAKSTLHDFTGATTGVEGELEADLARPAEAPSGSIRVDAASLDTGLEDRNAAMREHLGGAENARITFALSAFSAVRVDAAAMQVQGTARGRMTVHGVTRDVAMPVKMHVDSSRRLVVEGEMPLKMSDYEVEVPSKLGLISVQDEVRVWISLRARALPREEH